MRRKCLSTPPAWAFPNPEHADNSAPDGWGLEGSAGPKTKSIPGGAAPVSVDEGCRSANAGRASNGEEANRANATKGKGATNEKGTTDREAATTKAAASRAKGSSTVQAAHETPVALCCLTEIVDQPLEWVVEGVIPRGELTLITGEAGVGKSGFLAGLIANVTRGRPGPSDALRAEKSEHFDDLARPEGGSDSDPDTDVDFSADEDEEDQNEGEEEEEEDDDFDFDFGFNFDFDDEDDGEDDEDDEDEDTNPPVPRCGISEDRSDPLRSIVPAHTAEKRRSSSAAHSTPAAVVIFSTANLLMDAVRPRLIEAGADLEKIYALCQLETSQRDGAFRSGGGSEVGTVDDVGADKDGADADAAADGPSMRPRMFQWHRDLPVLEAELARLRTNRVEVSLIVIDAIDGFVDGPRRRSLLAADVEKLAELARKFRVGIVLAANVSPAAMLRSNRPRGMAGIDALSIVARTVWMIVRDLDVANGRMLVPIKKNRSMNPNGFAYCLQQGKIVWDDEPVGIQGEDFLREAILAPQTPLAREHQFEQDRAAKWLHQRLRPGKALSFEVQQDAAKSEIGDALLRRAFRSLGCKTNKEKQPGGKALWYWRLPGEGFFSRLAEPRYIAQPRPDDGRRYHGEKPKTNAFEH